MIYLRFLVINTFFAKNYVNLEWTQNILELTANHQYFCMFELKYSLIYWYEDRYEVGRNSGVVGMQCGYTFSVTIADIEAIFFRWLFANLVHGKTSEQYSE